MTTWDDASENCRKQIAVHEAGHAVVALKLGLDVEYVCARSATTQLAKKCTAHEYGIDLKDDELMQLYYAAGAAAEVIIFGCYDPARVSGDKKRITEAEELIEQSAGQDYQARGFDTYVELATEILHPYQPVISTVSRALLSGARLSCPHVLRIIDP